MGNTGDKLGYSQSSKKVTLYSATFAFLGLWSCGSVLAVGEDGVTLKGIYHYAVYLGAQQPRSSDQFNFEVSVKGCAWNIIYEDPGALTNADILDVKTIASCDGTNIYLSRFQNPDAVKKTWGSQYESVKDKLPVAMACIYRGNYPPPQESTLQNIWLPFASGCVLAEPAGKAKPPFVVDMAVFNSTNFDCDYVWTKNDSSRGLREIIFRRSGLFYARNPKTGKILQAPYPPPYDQGFTTAVGRWLRATNVGGISIPLDFEFTAFSPDQNGKSAADLLTAFICRCTITNVSSIATPPIPIALPQGKVLICDRRFENRGHAYITYEVHNGKWPTENNSDLNQVIAAAPKISLEDEALAELGIKPIGSAFSENPAVSRSHSRAVVVRTTLCMATVLPIALLVSKRLFNQTNKTKGTQ